MHAVPCVLALLAAPAAAHVLEIGLQRLPPGSAAHAAVLARRAEAGTYLEALAFNWTGGGFFANVSVGTPPQPQLLAVDTRTANTYVLAHNASRCRLHWDDQGCAAGFNPDNSSTYRMVADYGFQLHGMFGDLINETLALGGATAAGLVLGYLSSADSAFGRLGLGYHMEGPQWPTVLDVLQAQRQIPTRAYSLYLNDARAPEGGALLLGGVDLEKFDGPLVPLDIVPRIQLTNGSYPLPTNYSVVAVPLANLTVLTPDNATRTGVWAQPMALPPSQIGPMAAVLDSSNALLYTPVDLAYAIWHAAGVEIVDETAYIDCGANVSLALTLGTGNASFAVTVPPAMLALDVLDQSQYRHVYVPRVCLFGVQIDTKGNTPELDQGQGDPQENFVLLGDNILRALYAVVDLEHHQVGLAQARLNSTASAVYPLPVNATGLPATLTGGQPVPSFTPFVTPTPTPTPTSAAARAAGAARGPGGLLAGLAVLFLLGSGLV